MVEKIQVIFLWSILILLSDSVLSYATGYTGAGFHVDSIGPVNTTVDSQKYYQIRYVSSTRGFNESGDGSRENPWKSLTYALSKIDSASAEKKYAILVSEGTYHHGTVVMKEFVDLFGGFSPDNWKRDIFLYRSTLDGMGLRRVVFGADHTIIDGFTISGGVSNSHGGGILCLDTSPTITNNFIVNNLVMEPADFDDQHIYQEGHHGGGIACLYNSIPVIRNNLIRGNRTAIGIGGGVVFYGLYRKEGVEEPEFVDNRLVGGVQAILENNVIVENISGTNDIKRSRSSSGGGVACAHEARPIIRNNIIAHNQALGRSDAGGIYIKYFSYPQIEYNWILGNVCDDDGGGLYTMRQSQPHIKGNIFAGNWTHSGGCGALRLSKEGRAVVVENLIVSNPGGGVMSVDSYVQLEGNNIIDNSGGSAFRYVQNFSYYQPSLIQNNIMRGNEEGPLKITTDKGHPLTILNNNMDSESFLIDNDNFDPAFISDGLQDRIKSIEYDDRIYLSVIEPIKKLSDTEFLRGRIIHIGDRWGVIQKIVNGKIWVWGNFKEKILMKMDFEILPSYTISE